MVIEMKKVETWLPVFPGFYGTNYEPDEDNEIENMNDQREGKGIGELPYDAIEWGYKEYMDSVCESACSSMQYDLRHFISSLDYQDIHSPKEYNFRNDSVNIIVSLSEDDEKAIIRYLHENLSAFSDYIADRYTSRSGFISWHSSDAIDWMMEDDLLGDTYKLGSVLQFIWYNDRIQDMDSDLDFYYEVMEDQHMSATNYDECINLPYCSECSEFIKIDGMAGGVCKDCYELGARAGDHIVCACCMDTITNKWEERQFQYKIKHSLIKYDQVICMDCETVKV